LGHPCKFQRVSRFGFVTARHSSSGRQPNFAALNRGRHLYSAGRPSRWALAHILVAVWIHSFTVWKGNVMGTSHFTQCPQWLAKTRVVQVLNVLPSPYLRGVQPSTVTSKQNTTVLKVNQSNFPGPMFFRLFINSMTFTRPISNSRLFQVFQMSGHADSNLRQIRAVKISHDHWNEEWWYPMQRDGGWLLADGEVVVAI